MAVVAARRFLVLLLTLVVCATGCRGAARDLVRHHSAGLALFTVVAAPMLLLGSFLYEWALNLAPDSWKTRRVLWAAVAVAVLATLAFVVVLSRLSGRQRG